MTTETTTTTTTKRPQPELIIDGCRGIHIPWHFAQYYAPYWRGITAEQLGILESGPDHGDYWDVWNQVLDSALLRIASNGEEDWSLYHDGDLWAIPNGMVWDEDADWFVWPEDDDDATDSAIDRLSAADASDARRTLGLGE